MLWGGAIAIVLSTANGPTMIFDGRIRFIENGAAIGGAIYIDKGEIASKHARTQQAAEHARWRLRTHLEHLFATSHDCK